MLRMFKNVRLAMRVMFVVFVVRVKEFFIPAFRSVLKSFFIILFEIIYYIIVDRIP